MSRSNILRFFLPFSATVFSYLPFDRRTHRQLLGFLYLTQCMVKDMSHSKWFMHEKVLRRVMSRIIRLFGDDELLFVLQSLNKCKAHNHIALTSALCGTLPPPVRFSVSHGFVDFLKNSKHDERWFEVLSCFPERDRPNCQCNGISAVAHELRTLYKRNKLFIRVFRCSSRECSKRIFYNASRKKTKSFRALMTSLRRMKKALRVELYFSSRLNIYDELDHILDHFFHEMQSMQQIDWDELYESFSPTPVQYSITPEGTIEPTQLMPMKLQDFPLSQKDFGKLLPHSYRAFSFPKIQDTLLNNILILAKEPVSIIGHSRSTLSQALYFVLAMIWFHQSSDPFLGYFIRTIHNKKVDDPCYEQAYEFDLDKTLHVRESDGSMPKFLRMWNILNPKMWSQLLFLSNQYMSISRMFEMFYDIINNPDFFHQIEHFISENSSADLKSVGSFLSTMKATSLDERFRHMFHPFCLQPDFDPAFKNMFS